MAQQQPEARITSYNVCYTKLLRQGLEIGYRGENFGFFNERHHPPACLAHDLLTDQVINTVNINRRNAGPGMKKCAELFLQG